MSYITKNANLLLLLLIVIIAGSLVGATVYFQDKFGKINQEYDQKLAELSNVTAQVENYREVLQKAEVELELKRSREEQFTEKFTSEKSRADQLDRDLEDTLDELSATSKDLGTKTAEADSLVIQVSNLENDVNAKKKKIDNLEDKVDCLEDTADALEDDDC